MDIVKRLRNHALPDPHDEREVLHAPLLREAADEIVRLRHHLTELGKAADAAGLVLATLDAESSDEEERIQAIIDGISQWALPAILTPNV